MVTQLFRQAYRSKFMRNVTVLTTGSFLAQLIPLLMLPVFARMFTAEVFGIQGILQLGIVILVPLATGYYDWAIPTPRQQGHARGLATISITLAVILSILFGIIIALLRRPIIEILHIPEIGHWIFVYPVIVLATSLSSIANYWLLREGKFGLQSLNKVVLASSTALVTLIYGWKHVGDGLLIGFVAGLVITAIWGLMQAVRKGFYLTRDEPISYFLRMVRQYGHFPMFGSIPTVINNTAAQLPMLIITANYSLAVAGHFTVTRGILVGGVLLFSTCIGQAILKHTADLAQNNKRVWPFFFKITLGLAAFSFCLMAGTYIIGPWFFRLYLGSGWEDSAEMTRMLAFCTFFWLMGPALSSAVIAVHRIKAVALWQVSYGLLQPLLLLFTHLPFHQFIWLVVAFESGAYALYTAIMIFTIWRFDQQQQAKKAKA